MSDPAEDLQKHLRDAGDCVAQEVRRAVQYIDEEVVPEVRRTGSAALRMAAENLRKVADRLDDERRNREMRGL